MQRADRTTRLLAAMLCVVLAGLLLPSIVQAQKRPPSRQLAVASPDRTDAGEWSGTWFYHTRSEKWALWMRETDGVPEMKLQYLNKDRAENFKTDWHTIARYSHRESKGLCQLTFNRRDENVIQGDWYWEVGTEDDDSTARIETATFRIYRAGLGRQLVLRFEDFERRYISGDEDLRIAAMQAWTFHKASRRLVLWNELPF